MPEKVFTSLRCAFAFARSLPEGSEVSLYERGICGADDYTVRVVWMEVD